VRNKIGSWIILVIFIFSLTVSTAQAQTASSTPTPANTENTSQSQAQLLLNSLTPEERVGQLFIITFNGTDYDENSQIYDLIVNHHVGGVVLLAENDNFTAEGTVPNAYQLIGQLQTDEWTGSQGTQPDPVTGKTYSPTYIPLLVGIQQEGDGSPYNQILTGLTDLPNEMAIGATWDTTYANDVGNVMGSELAAIGFNLFLGPSLDVLEITQSTGYNDLGTQTFGGDPFWVGEMGKAYIAGIHEGSDNRMAVVSTHFPGSGSADRSPEEEVATVRKSLEQLKQIELAPFFAVTGNSTSEDTTTDGLLVSHIRYQGFQGNIRDTTKPVSFDSTALSQLMSLDEFASWRNDGGVLVSDDLGSRAVRRFYDATEATFNARTVAKDAFLAGNDLLYANNFVANGDPDSHTTIVSTLEFFAQKYREDPAFQQKVDASVLRILTLKYKLYPSFKITSVIPSDTGLNSVNTSQDISFEVAQNSVTLISPSETELESLLPNPPQISDKIIFFTDGLEYQQCSTCSERDAFAIDGLQKAVLKLYGPQVSGQVRANNLSSYSFADLQSYLDGNTTDTETMISDLNNAGWVIFSTLAIDSNRPETSALRNLLAKRPNLLQNKKVIVFGFNAPYFLDATDISKLTAFYGLYSKGASFLDVAARVLFHELSANGNLPVSVSGVGYDVIVETSPDPAQIIPLYIDNPGQTTATLQVTTTPNPTIITGFSMGDTINLQTGVIYDHNQNTVPDGTGVQFILTYSGVTSNIIQIERTTVSGVATLAYQIDQSGQLSINVISDQATNSGQITLTIPGGITPGVGVTVILPTQESSNTSTATEIPSATIEPTITNTPTRSGKPNAGEWFLAILLIAVGGGLSFSVSFWLLNSLRWGIRWGLCTIVSGLVLYSYLSSSLPGAKAWIEKSGTDGVLGISFLGVILGWTIGFVWWFINQKNLKDNPPSIS
jgi:beta-N-acetylhexosaminidase